jgi:hypothetical protein
MPFDRISPAQMRAMRLVTAAAFLALSGGLLWLSAATVRSAGAGASSLDLALPLAAFVQGAFIGNAGLMLAELTTRAPRKLSINVPFVAANFQTSLTVGLVALAPAVTLPGAASGTALPGLVMGALALNLMFVVLTKLHWNHAANTGTARP